jgi:hypothetical protein
MPVVFTKGSAQEFIADRDFTINWDDRTIKSVKVRLGESVFYDGNIAQYTKASGELVASACTGLKSAINVMGWLVLKNGKSPEEVPVHNQTVKAPDDFDGLKGGSIDTHTNKEMQAGNLSAGKVIHEKDLVVKKVPNLKEPQVKKGKTTDLEVVGDQVAVKEVPSKSTLVSSSTVTARKPSYSKKVIQSDEMGSDYTKPITLKSSKTASKPKSTILINDTIPRILPEDMTQEEVNKVKKVIQEDESQGAKVVRKVAISSEVQQVEGITLRKTVSKESSPKAKVSSGSTPITDIMDDGVVVARVGEKQVPKTVSPKLSPEAVKKAEAAKAARKASSIKTADAIAELAKSIVQPKTETTEDTDYLSMLPDTWAEMHWVQKEKFIKSVTNIGFLKFILTVESIKAVLDACETRIRELEQA